MEHRAIPALLVVRKRLFLHSACTSRATKAWGVQKRVAQLCAMAMCFYNTARPGVLARQVRALRGTPASTSVAFMANVQDDDNDDEGMSL